MDPVIIKSLTAELSDNPMFLLDIPESIFELFEADKPTGSECHTGFNSTPSSNDSSALPSLYCSTECSRCESLASTGDVANLMELYDGLAVDGDISDMVDSMIDDSHLLKASNTEPHSSRFRGAAIGKTGKTTVALQVKPCPSKGLVLLLVLPD